MNRVHGTIAAAAFGCFAVAAQAQWVNFANETSDRLISAPGSVNHQTDTEEKDYAWGDVDQDGDIDLVVVRKQPFTSTGKRTNALLMNEGISDGHSLNGVLVDRTAEYVTDSDIEGDQGFLTPTNDRDVVLVDVDGDGWLDIVTATTLTDNQAKNLSHPRVYMNKGEQGGIWQGYKYEDARIPQMHPTAGPRFCSVAAGDVTGDGAPDLYFGDYDSGGTQIYDYNNRLLINDGNGFFTDETTSRLTTEMALSAFGAASIIADINQDGVNDVVKQTSLNAPTHVAVTYNNPANEGFFNDYDIVNSNSPYFVSAGDLDGDGDLDLLITDDGTDVWLINQGNNAAGEAVFTTQSCQGTGGFGGDSVIEDLNNDGMNDFIITDVDVDIPGCNRRTFIFRNTGGTNYQEQGQVIPFSLLTGVHDAAVFDLNGDGWKDIVLGRCSGTWIWINQPPVGMVFTYPGGLPSFLPPGEGVEVEMSVAGIGAEPVPGSARMYVAVNGGSFDELPMQPTGKNTYVGTIPAADCTDDVELYFAADLTGGSTFTDPPNAPASTFEMVAALGTQLALRDEIEGDVSGWMVVNESLENGAWQQAEPNGTSFGGDFAAPNMDATAGSENVLAFVTQNGAPGEEPGISDIDGGPTYLISPVIDLEGTDGTISYSRWFYSDGGVQHVPDFMTVDISNDGGQSWVPVPGQTTGGTNSDWETASFQVGNYLEPTSSVRVRFGASDQPNNSITEAGIDNFQVDVLDCGEVPCPADITGDGDINVSDLVTVISTWGPCDGACAADINGDGQVDVSDLIQVISGWGACP